MIKKQEIQTEQTPELQEQEQMEEGNQQESPETEIPEPMSASARERGAVVLEVLAGTLTPAEAAECLGINPPAYYNLESKGLQGLVRACESRPKGPGVNYKKQIRTLEESNRKLEREARRYQSLTRAAQKAIGVMQEEESPRSYQKSTGSTGPKKRGPKVRAQRAADRLRGKKRTSKKKSKTIQSLQKTGT